MAEGLQIEDYSDRSFVVRGDTYPHREALKDMGGKWQTSLKKGGKKGWIFGMKRKKAVVAWMKKTLGGKAGGAKVVRTRQIKRKEEEEDVEGEKMKATRAQRRRLIKRTEDSDDDVGQMQWSDDDEEEDGGGDDDDDEDFEVADEEEDDDDSDGNEDFGPGRRVGSSSSKVKRRGRRKQGGSSKIGKTAGIEGTRKSKRKGAVAQRRKRSMVEDSGSSEDGLDDFYDDGDDDYEEEEEEELSSDEEGEEFEGESEDEDEMVMVMVTERGGQSSSTSSRRAGSSSTAGKGKKTMKRGGGKLGGKKGQPAAFKTSRSNAVKGATEFVLGRIGLGFSGGGTKRSKRKKSSSWGAASTRDYGGDFPELLPPPVEEEEDDEEEEWSDGGKGKKRRVMSSSRSSSKETKKGSKWKVAAKAGMWDVAGMTPPERRTGILALPLDVHDEQLLPCLGQKEMCRVHSTCKFFELLLDEPSRWAHIPYLDLRYKTLSIAATTARGRTTELPPDMVGFKIMRVLPQERMAGITGVDLRGTSLGTGRGQKIGPSILVKLTENCPRVRRLLLQGPGEELTRWSEGLIEHHIVQHIADQVEELGLEIDNVNALRLLLRSCPSLHTLHLGGSKFSRQLTPPQFMKLFDPPITPSLRVLEIMQQNQFSMDTVDHIKRCMPGLRRLVLRRCAGPIMEDGRLFAEALFGSQYLGEGEGGEGFRLVVIREEDEKEGELAGEERKKKAEAMEDQEEEEEEKGEDEEDEDEEDEDEEEKQPVVTVTRSGRVSRRAV